MNIAVVHYHLNRGGVTQVIFNQLRALNENLEGERWRAVVFFGGRHDAWLNDLQRLESIDVTLCQLPSLDYDDSRATPRPDSLGEEIAGKLAELDFAPHETVVHAHNASLGLNVSLPGALLWLAERGYSLLFQIHDFPEDFRPLCFRRATAASKAAARIARNGNGCGSAGDLPPDADTSYCYPQAPQIHYAVINSRDHSILSQAGFSGERLHLLPNPVAEPHERFPREAARKRLEEIFDVPAKDRYVLYPVRCIRRKNVGEALLWSSFARGRATFGLTLPPENPICARAYEAWKDLGRALDLPCRFEVGREGALRYPENIAAADLILSTSIVEGFGMVYLESWLTDHQVAGRDLPEITTDFVDSGLRLNGLRDGVEVPIDWVGRREFRELLEDGYERVLAEYSVVPATDHEGLRRRIDERLDEGRIDFGELSEDLQSPIIEKVTRDARARATLEAWNPWILESLSALPKRDDIVHNAGVVRSRFGFSVSGRRLLELYRNVASSERHDSTTPLASPGHIVDRLLDPRRYRPIAT